VVDEEIGGECHYAIRVYEMQLRLGILYQLWELLIRRWMYRTSVPAALSTTGSSHHVSPTMVE
jgi:hypothetical protein